MYNARGNEDRITWIHEHNFSHEMAGPTPARIKLLEDTELFDIQLKIEVLEMFHGSRFVTEVILTEADRDQIIDLIEQLGFYFYESQKLSKKTGKEFKFLIVCANEAVYEYVKKYEYQLNDFELGILYGYHHKSILAFCGLIAAHEKAMPSDKPFIRYGQKVFSRDYFEEEEGWYGKRWEEMGNISNEIMSHAEK